ncbi:MAG: hypothetical protein GXO30_04965 [Epsilonproteobacteria bacterium]|nr:hypothetical protein [Campylobacterota bacterium]
MENQTNIEKLNNSVTQIMQKYNNIKEELDTLRTEVVTLKAEKELKENEIEKLREDNVMKDLEIEEIVEKIESILG